MNRPWLSEPSEEIKALIKRGAVFYINSSAGKDSQAMFHYVHRHVPAEQIRVIHAHLAKVEWGGVIEHIHATTLGVPVIVCQSRRDLLQMIKERGMFPSPKFRQCTSDLKRGPIEKAIRQSEHKLIVNCMGMRAEESAKRAKQKVFKFNKRNSRAGREWYDWLPIHEWKKKEVFDMISEVGQKPHWAYEAGMSRLSCVFCIMANKEDLTTAARLNPELYRTYVELEQSTGQVMMMPSKKYGRLSLVDITGVKI